MARIRSVKPEFWTSEQIAECSPNARLLFIGMWSFADDAGVHKASPRRLKMEVFPSDDFGEVAISVMVGELVKAGLVEVYQVEDETYWKVTGWEKHQRIDQPTYRHPLPDGSVPTTVRRRPSELDSSNVRRTSDERSVGERSGVDWKGKREKKEHGKTTIPKSASGKAIEIDTWLSSLGDTDAVPATDPIFDYAEKAGIPLDFLAMSWKRFVDDMRERKTRKRNWVAHYRNAVRGNWFKLWWFTPEGDCRLTTVGEQERRAAAA
jgi:hypothetical protein